MSSSRPLLNIQREKLTDPKLKTCGTMPLSEEEVEELLENLEPDADNNFTKENIIEVKILTRH